MSSDFPYMTDAEVEMYWSAMDTPAHKRSETEKRAIRQWAAQPALMSLDALMATLKSGGELSPRLQWKLEELVELSDLEVA